MLDFSLSAHLTRFQTADKRAFPPVDDATRKLNSITDRLTIAPEEIESDPDLLETLIDLTQGFSHLLPKLQLQLSYLVSSSLKNLAQGISTSLLSDASNAEVIALLPTWKSHMELYGYLQHVIMTFLQDDVASASLANTIKSGNRRQGAASSTELFKRSCSQIEGFLDAMTKVLGLNLSKVFQTTPERDLFIGLFTRPLFVLVETEQVVKVQSLKLFIINVIATCVKKHGQYSSVQNAILSNLTYFPHLTAFNAELLQVISTEFEYPQLTEDLLKDISNKEFNSKDTTGPKAISSFLVSLSELVPKVVLRQMTLLVKLLNNSSFTLRCAVVEVCGNIIVAIAKNRQDIEHHGNQIEVLLELLEERFLDSNPYVRSKAIQGCLKVCELESKFNKHRTHWVKLAVQSLQDRSSLVRRNVVKLLSKLILTHPFTQLHGTQLRLSDWENRHSIALKELNKLLKEEDDKQQESLDDIVERSLILNDQEDEERPVDGSELSKLERECEKVNSVHTEAIYKMKLTVLYYHNAIGFIHSIHEGIKLACNLLFSKNRNEVLETMDFFVLTDAYGIELSSMGIKRMLHLVWMKGSNDEGTSIASHLMECYRQLFLTAPDNANYKEKSAYVAKNLINLTKDASVADLASLEKLVGMMYDGKLIDQHVVNVLWAIYNSVSKGESSTFTTDHIHGSIIVLGMLALADCQIALKGLDQLLNSGLGDSGQKDLILARFSCIALQRMVHRDAKFSSDAEVPRQADAVDKLHAKIIEYTEDPNYYAMCEQAINALFRISHNPDVVCSAIIKEKIMMTFGERDELPSAKSSSYRIISLAHLLFIVGQVAIKLVVYLENCEAEFKKRKIENEMAKKEGKTAEANANNAEADVSMQHEDENHKELEMIGGTNEDDFSDAVNFIKENELLFGDNSLLARFGPLVEEIVSNTGRFKNQMLQRSAVLCLEKLMCVSSKYCERNLPLLITMMEKSEDPIIRSNAVLGLGDMAVCFNNLVDENTDYLYHRLHDESIMVQRTCLMTVTFLILAGQVKVKGQLGQMAKCLENADQGISDMCKLFFSELATKDNAIYNGFIDIFSGLSSDNELNKDSFRRIIKFLLSFIDKERHQKQLCEKLLTRISKAETQKQWDDVAFVLSNLPNKSEKAAAVLEAGFKLVSARE
ncbi:AGR273Cp [Eremothecium gossypii ATCC 10895]|uniref:Condensin complex subunit 1 n=1 Tax=Eremothecium gossypii (strain ATCC 10895 / CBS 109.51 / FGSC 9923 / NRRL Y-1056) TaxID=284811 RepID=Q74ZC6_EREGS|nr:AGR273Cp [Eremothecium gossypii ATCC 10895]AAS54763.2 AGR273Cp [Eremothecium gossypii ATCC 10895]AEY99094.1 FAGR273Cp [Eremothecium gossypii FDAG1]